MHVLRSATSLTITVSTVALALAGPALAEGHPDARRPDAPVAKTKVRLPSGVTVGPTVESVTEYRFPNGLRVLLYPDGGTSRRLVNITYSVGAAQEGIGESGMAHLLEHLLFRGTPTTPNIAPEFRRRGIDFNGSTGQDRTNYYGNFPANDETLEWLIGVEADRMLHANVTKADLDTEMTVVRNELELAENRPVSLLIGQLGQQAYQWHPYGKSVLGNRSELENVPIDRLQAFYARWYQPDNATLIVAGPIDPGKVLAIIERTVGAVPRPRRTCRPPTFANPRNRASARRLFAGSEANRWSASLITPPRSPTRIRPR